MGALVPVWIIGGPIVALLILSFMFKGPSAMGGTMERLPPRATRLPEQSAPLLDPVAPAAPRRIV